MKCNEIKDLLEEYVSGELDDKASHAVEAHLRECKPCYREYEEMRDLVAGLREMKDVFKPKEVFDMAKLEGATSKRRAAKHERRRSGFGTRILAAVAVLALAVSVTSSSLLAFPALAKQVPALPIVQDMKSLETKNKAMQTEIDRLKIEIREIKGTKVKVVESGKPALNEQDNLKVQELVMDFVRLQYKGDIDGLKKLSTPDFAKRIGKRPAEFLKHESGTVAFGSITSVAKEGEDLLVFVRISDSKTFVDSEYQENFVIKIIDGSYLVDDVAMDA